MDVAIPNFSLASTSVSDNLPVTAGPPLSKKDVDTIAKDASNYVRDPLCPQYYLSQTEIPGLVGRRLPQFASRKNDEEVVLPYWTHFRQKRDNFRTRFLAKYNGVYSPDLMSKSLEEQGIF